MKIIKKSLFVSLIAAVMTFYPVTALAETTPTTPSESSAVTSTPAPTDTTSPSTDPAPTTTAAPTPAAEPSPAPSSTPVAATPAPTPTNTQGPQTPPGADGKKYHLNTETGKYESDYYVWDPVTKKTSPKNTPSYSYNPTTGLWDTTKWAYDAPTGKYVPNVSSTGTPPDLTTSPLTNSGGSNAGAKTLGVNGINTTGPDSQNTITNKNKNSADFDLFYNAAISNNINQNTVSGNALLTGNTTAGNAATGNAMSMANIINLLQSGWNPATSGDLAMFNANITGDVTGDLLVDPGTILNTGPDSQQTINNNSENNLKVNAQSNGNITNNVDLNSKSGDATVAGNTKAGDATTGNASAMANIVNAISSSIAAGKSFLGSINITGNLNGDILLPPGLLDSLISGTGPDSSTTINNSQTNTLTAHLTDNQNINNNVNANAASGTATTAGNTKAGDATSGTATTKVNILNLTGKQVVGKDALLVFVNVLGKWTGIIVNAPTGATSAALGGGVSQNNTLANNIDINATNNSTIDNNVNVNAASGDASVTHNTTAGNAKSGNATAGVNIANITDSNLSFTDWFGILFINVFGSWNGSFGVNTAAGDPPASPSTTGSTTTTATPTAVLHFVSKAADGTQKTATAAVTTPETTSTAPEEHKTAVLGSNNTNTPAAGSTAIQAHQMNLMWVPFAGSGLGLLILLASEVARRRSAAHVTTKAIAL